MVELQKVSKQYDDGTTKHPVLQELSLKVNAGEIVVILGKSGSGKSTLLNLISGIDTPSGGSILLDGEAVSNQTDRERTLFRRRHMGFVFQFFNLVPTLTVQENLLLPRELVQGRVAEADEHDAKQLLKGVGLEGRHDSYPDQLSGGEQQRVAIARAIIHDPKLILADEPTGNLDYETGETVLRLLDEMVRKKQKTMIMATHSREVIGMADRVFQLYQGKLTKDNLEL